MQILNFNLRLNKTNNNYVELRYFEDNRKGIYWVR